MFSPLRPIQAPYWFITGLYVLSYSVKSDSEICPKSDISVFVISEVVTSIDITDMMISLDITDVIISLDIVMISLDITRDAIVRYSDYIIRYNT